MTTERIEIVFEGTRDGETWEEYELPHKPGDPTRRPTQSAPHMPRLDWGLWFAGLGAQSHLGYVPSVKRALEEGRSPVVELFAEVPFDEPPARVRVRRYRYRFASAEERGATGRFWVRTPL